MSLKYCLVLLLLPLFENTVFFETVFLACLLVIIVETIQVFLCPWCNLSLKLSFELSAIFRRYSALQSIVCRSRGFDELSLSLTKL